MSSRSLLVFPFLLAVAIAQRPYGDPTPGAAGFKPRLHAGSSWIGNMNFGFDIAAASGGVPAFLQISLAPTNQSVIGFHLLVDLNVSLGSIFTVTNGFQPGDGTAHIGVPLGIPASPNFIGAAFYAQAIMLDSGSVGGVFSASQGWRFELGLPPLIFVGTSILNNDPYQLVEPTSNTIVATGSPPEVNNVTKAVFMNGGKRLFTASSIRGAIGMADLTVSPPVWNTIWQGVATSTYGIAADHERKWVWTITDPGSGARELVAIDVDQGRPTFGLPVAATYGVAFGYFEKFSLAPNCRRAALITFLPQTLTIVDTESGSPTFCQNLISALPIPTDQPGGTMLFNDIEITPDSRYVMMVGQFPGAAPTEVAVYDMLTNTWVDHNPNQVGAQNIGPYSLPVVNMGSAATTIEMSRSGTFAIISGMGGCGWVGRLDLDPNDATYFAWQQWNPGVSLQNSWTAALSPDDLEVAVSTWQKTGCTAMGSPVLRRFDSAQGILLGSIPIPYNSNPSTLQNLYSVVYN